MAIILLDVSQSSQAFALAIPSAQNAVPSAWNVFTQISHFLASSEIMIARLNTGLPVELKCQTNNE